MVRLLFYKTYAIQIVVDADLRPLLARLIVIPYNCDVKIVVKNYHFRFLCKSCLLRRSP